MEQKGHQIVAVASPVTPDQESDDCMPKLLSVLNLSCTTMATDKVSIALYRFPNSPRKHKFARRIGFQKE